MTVSDSQTPYGKEARASYRPRIDRVRNARPSSAPAEARAPVLYDKVDYRLMDTFPASDAVAQY